MYSSSDSQTPFSQRFSTNMPTSAPAMRGNADRTERAGDGRNRRMFANIQQALGGTGATPLPGSSRTPRVQKRDEEPVEKLDDLDAIIAQISDLSVRADRSAQQIKRNIAASSYLKEMNEEEWETLTSSLVKTALESGESDFVAGLFVSFMDYEGFCDSISSQLMSVCSSFIMEPNPCQSDSSIPVFLGTLLCSNWPRNMSKAIDSVNIVLYVAMSIVKGWLIVLTEDNTAEMGQNVPELPSDSDEEEDEGQEKAVEREDAAIVNRCAAAVTALCDSTQRSLWMKWPELVDEIYAAIKPAITHNNRIEGNVKARLLKTMIDLHAWTKTGAVTKRTSATQTI